MTFTNIKQEPSMATTATVETITPSTAAQYLQSNVGNRPVANGRVEAYAGEMRAGRWLLTGEPIIFDGVHLLNGQHRLMACIKANVAFETVVVRNVSSQSFAVLDSGLPRSMGHVLHAAGVSNSSMVSATAALVLSYAAGKTTKMDRPRSRQEILAHVQQHQDRYEHAKKAGNAAKYAKLTPSVFAAFGFFAFEHQRFDEFTSGVLSGANLSGKDPRLALRNWMFAPTNRGQQRPKFCAVIKAWNAFTDDQPLTKIYAYTGGVYPTGNGFYDLNLQEAMQ